MKTEALFCDGTEKYVRPSEPQAGDKVTFTFRTAANDVDQVKLLFEDQTLVMKKSLTTGGFDYYSVSYVHGDQAKNYCFQIIDGEEVCYFTKWGVESYPRHDYLFRLTSGFSVPDWAKGAVMYQIYIDRFCNGDPDNDVETREYNYIGAPVHKVESWDKMPQAMDVREFYGGDIQGIIDKLDYLQWMGVEVIYCNPLFVSPSNHKYDTQDYDYIDPHIGKIVCDGGAVLPEGEMDNLYAEKYRIRTADRRNLEASNELFIKLVQEVHQRGMKIIMDGVFNHCGSFHKWLDKEKIYKQSDGYFPGAYQTKDSPYHDYFQFQNQEEEAWPDNDSYAGWWGFDTLPKLNYEGSEKLEEYILQIGRKWVSEPYCADGWRLDVAADLGKTDAYNHQFWKKFRKAVKEANPNALILAEHYGNPQRWLEGDEWDTVMNYDAFMEPVTWFLTGMEKHSDQYCEELLANAEHFRETIKAAMTRLTFPSLMTAMNQLSNHDHSRFLTRTNHKVGRVAELGSAAAEEGVDYATMRNAIVMQMTWVGAPTLYYGDEAGVCGFTDPDCRRTYPWGNENLELLKFYREMIKIHRHSMALRKGSIRILYAENEILAYARFTDEEKMVVIIHPDGKVNAVTIPVWQAEIQDGRTLARVIYSYENGYVEEFEEYQVVDGKISLMMGKNSSIVLKCKNW